MKYTGLGEKKIKEKEREREREECMNIPIQSEKKAVEHNKN